MVPVGKVVGVFGIDGRVKVESMTSFEERFDVGQKLWIGESEYKITWSSWHKGQARIKLSGVSTPEGAESLRGCLLCVPAEDRPELDEDEFYTADLIGMRVVDQNGRELGRLDEVLDYPAHEILVVGEIMIPAIKEFVKMIDFDTDTIEVQLIPGMEGDEPAPKPDPQAKSKNRNRLFKKKKSTKEAQ